MPEPIRVGLVSLGCAKNLVDSEIMLGLLRERGMEITPRQEEADVLVVNTCGFIGPARKEAVTTIVEMAEEKRRGRCRALVVTGCLVQDHGEELWREIPEIDAIVGTGDYARIADVVERALQGERVRAVGPPQGAPLALLPRVRATGGATAYVKVAEGCDHRCTFCIIPRLRGPHRSRPVAEVEREVRTLAAQGVREICLIAQDTTRYRGLGPDGRPWNLAQLLRHLGRVEEVAWFRVLYAYPASVTPELVEAMATTPKVARYLDIPFQHADDRVLRRMGRPGGQAQLRRLVERLRQAMPDITLRTTFIVGFPGETEEEFATLVEFVREMELDHVGVFTYSREDGTPAGEMPDQVPEPVKRARRARLLAVQAQVAERRRRRWVGQEVPILVEGISRGRPRMPVGRGPMDAPDVDGVTYLLAGPAPVGEVVTARILDVRGPDLLAEAVTARASAGAGD